MTAAGIVVAFAAAFASALAVVLQAGEARLSPRREGGHPSLLIHLARRPGWLAGTGLMVLAWPLQVLALTLAPLAIVQPMLSTSLLVLLAVARLRLNEQVGRPEALGTLAIVVGIIGVVLVSPPHTDHIPDASRLAVPIAVVGAAAVVAYVVGRFHSRTGIAVVLCAGLAYAWADFANKLLSDELDRGRLGLAGAWLAATLAFGALAFLEENSALQRRPAVTVAPVIGALQVPLPVLMALSAGVEAWSSTPLRIGVLIAGLVLVAAGAATLGRSETVARASREEWGGPGRDPVMGSGRANPVRVGQVHVSVDRRLLPDEVHFTCVVAAAEDWPAVFVTTRLAV